MQIIFCGTGLVPFLFFGSEVAAMVLSILGRVVLFILKLVVKIVVAAGATAFCMLKILLLILLAVGQIVLGVTKIGTVV